MALAEFFVEVITVDIVDNERSHDRQRRWHVEGKFFTATVVVSHVRRRIALVALIRQRVRSPGPRRVHFILAEGGSSSNGGFLCDSDTEHCDEHCSNSC